MDSSERVKIMETTLNTKVTGISVKLSLVEALAFLKDPTRMQHEMMTMLRGGGIDVSDYENNPSTKKGEVCPHCLVRFKGLNIHLAKGCKHESGLNDDE